MGSRSLHLDWRNTHTVTVPEEENTLTLTLGIGGWLDPLAGPHVDVQGSEETNNTILGVAAVVLAHDWLDGLGGLIGVVERNGGDVVMEDVSLDDTVEELATNESKLTIDGSGGTTGKVPRVCVVVRKRWVSVLKVGDGDWCGGQ